MTLPGLRGALPPTLLGPRTPCRRPSPASGGPAANPPRPPGPLAFSPSQLELVPEPPAFTHAGMMCQHQQAVKLENMADGRVAARSRIRCRVSSSSGWFPCRALVSLVRSLILGHVRQHEAASPTRILMFHHYVYLSPFSANMYVLNIHT